MFTYSLKVQTHQNILSVCAPLPSASVLFSVCLTKSKETSLCRKQKFINHYFDIRYKPCKVSYFMLFDFQIFSAFSSIFVDTFCKNYFPKNMVETNTFSSVRIPCWLQSVCINGFIQICWPQPCYALGTKDVP